MDSLRSDTVSRAHSRRYGKVLLQPLPLFAFETRERVDVGRNQPASRKKTHTPPSLFPPPSPCSLTLRYDMSYGAKTAMAVYEAHEEDYDFDQYGQLLRPSPARPTSDTPDNVYWDDNSLLDSWAAALLDFKVIPLTFSSRKTQTHSRSNR